MTDYFDPRNSRYEQRRQEQEYSHSQSLSYTGDNGDENAIRRSTTRASNQSQATASTRSWVYSNQVNPPPPHMETSSAAGPTPFHGPRPLPEPQYHQQQYQQHPTFRRPLQYADTLEEDEADDQMPPDNGISRMYGYQQEGFEPARPIVAGPSTSVLSIPGGPPPANRRNRSFVGGFFSGLKRIPRIFGGGEKKRLVRQGTFGTETSGFTGGNTLPRYLSNPSIGPSNPQFAHRLSMAVANGSLPPDSTPAVFRPHLAGPQFPSFMVTPPSDGIADEEQAVIYDDEPTNDDPQYSEESEHHTTPMDRTTVMVYNTDSQAPTVAQAPSSSFPVRPNSVYPTSVRATSVHPTPIQSPGPRVSYQTELPTRANSQARTQSYPMPPTTPLASPPLRPRQIPRPSPLGRPPQDAVSAAPTGTSRYTGTTATSHYDPSFASDLSPVEKFFKGLYNLPWVAQQRVTVDYRPGDTPRAKGKIRSMKKPKSSWYHGVLLRQSRDVDLLSGSGTVTSGRTSNILSSLGSPISRRSGRSSTNRHHHASKPRHRRRRRTATSTSSDMQSTNHPNGSPLIPNVYPYTVPPYPPYSYPYAPAGYPTMPMPMMSQQQQQQMQQMQQTSPRVHGPRAARSHHRHGRAAKYPQGGFTPYQPMAMPGMPPPMPIPPQGAPMYFITPSPPQSHDGDGNNMVNGHGGPGQGPVHYSPVLVQYVPGAFQHHHDPGAANTMVSPPVTPQRPAHRTS